MALLGLLRLFLFAALLVQNKVVQAVLSFVVGAGWFLLLTDWIFGPGRREPMTGGALLAIGPITLLMGWNMVRQALAPDDMMIISEY